MGLRGVAGTGDDTCYRRGSGAMWSVVGDTEKTMATVSVFENNRTQAVLIPAEMRFAAGISKVNVRAVGPDLVLSPVGHTWDTFFLEGAAATDDVRVERGDQGPQECRPLE